jgi:oligopeptide/dipeptide ABC transporter ATP-binding protein
MMENMSAPSDSQGNPAILEIIGLKKTFNVRRGFFSGEPIKINALNGVDLSIYRNETLGLVGESGCGKSTLGRLVMHLDEPTEGRILFHGQDIFAYERQALSDYFRKIQLIFQDPQASLNPRNTAGNIIGEPLLIHKIVPPDELKERVAEIMETVGLSRDQMNRYPHEFSGGQRQRIGIARAISLKPEMIIADEPVSALDVSIQAQILNLLKQLQQSFGLTYIFITHDLGVVRHMSDRIAVMYLGRIVELAENRELYDHPLHPYTRAIFSAVPVPYPGKSKKRFLIKGDASSPSDSLTGCSFYSRCTERMNCCNNSIPELVEKSNGHYVACHLACNI